MYCTSPYLFYAYCPLDYCLPPTTTVYINLSLPNGSDAQCANNRTGLLCASCAGNYSLSLGSSKCIECPDNWYGLLAGITVATIIAGIVLVIMLLVLNITVAVGTLDSIIFYVNIINVNRNAYFSQSNIYFVPVFISWLNLDIGIDTCFYPGMDTYAKTWLKLAFPTYIIFLVILIIILCRFSSTFSNLLGRRNPVATLATLMLLSYTKYLQIIIASFSFATLVYPNGTEILKWLPDANVRYVEWKHIILVCVATIIIILGLLYTVLIFSWQWLLRCSRSKLFRWTRNQKLHSFIDTYHTPHPAKHRYWTGLLLFIRVIIYTAAAISLSEDPRIILLTTIFIISFLILYKTLLIIRVYKNWLLNAMESFIFFNIISFAAFTWYTFDDPDNKDKGILQTIVAYISVGTVVLLFMLVLVYHAYRYCSTKLYILGENTKFSKKLKSRLPIDQSDIYGSHEGDVTHTFLDAIDDTREGVHTRLTESLLQVPTTSAVSFEDCEEADSLENSSRQSLVRSLQQDQNTQSEFEESRKSRSRTKSQSTSQLADSYQLVGLESVRKAKAKSFTVRTTNKSLTKPLLSEEPNL